eukprot:937784-Prorocentrum_minimum.AAC.4
MKTLKSQTLYGLLREQSATWSSIVRVEGHAEAEFVQQGVADSYDAYYESHQNTSPLDPILRAPSRSGTHRRATYARVAKKQQQLLVDFEKESAKRRHLAYQKFLEEEQKLAELRDMEDARKEVDLHRPLSAHPHVHAKAHFDKPKPPSAGAAPAAELLPTTDRRHWTKWAAEYERKRERAAEVETATRSEISEGPTPSEGYSEGVSEGRGGSRGDWEEWGQSYERRRKARSVVEVESEQQQQRPQRQGSDRGSLTSRGSVASRARCVRESDCKTLQPPPTHTGGEEALATPHGFCG